MIQSTEVPKWSDYNPNPKLIYYASFQYRRTVWWYRQHGEDVFVYCELDKIDPVNVYSEVSFFFWKPLGELV